MSTRDSKINTLNTLKKFEFVNRLICYACVIPFFYTTSCLSQKKNVPAIAKAGCVGFGASIVAAVAIKTKEEKIKDELEKIKKKKEKSYY